MLWHDLAGVLDLLAVNDSIIIGSTRLNICGLILKGIIGKVIIYKK